jgi:hypothetical protein
MLEALAMPYTTPPIGLSPVASAEKGEPLDGAGILSGAVLDDERTDRELAAEREKNRVFAERQISLKKVLDDVDAAFSRSPYLAEKLNRQVTEEISDAAHETFVRFQNWCADWGLPCLPTTEPQALALFIVEEAKDGPHARRIVNQIASVYHKLNPSPWTDPLVRVIVDAFKDESPKPH